MAPSPNAHWKQTTENLPQGCTAAWHAMINGQAVAGIFQLVAGDTHMLCFQVQGDEKPTVERFPGIQQALERANTVLSTRICIPR